MEPLTYSTRSLDRILQEIRRTSFGDALETFRVNEVEEVRLPCLGRMKQSFMPDKYADKVERIASALVTHNDDLWCEFLETYLFCRASDQAMQHALRFVLGAWPEADVGRRSKAVCGRLDRALDHGEDSIWKQGESFVASELHFFQRQCSTFPHFYGQGNSTWHRFERVARLVLKAKNVQHLPTFVRIEECYRSRKNAPKASWEATDTSLFPIIRAQQHTFIREVLKTLRKIQRNQAKKGPVRD